jgi:hypothetical protein
MLLEILKHTDRHQYAFVNDGDQIAYLLGQPEG